MKNFEFYMEFWTEMLGRDYSFDLETETYIPA